MRTRVKICGITSVHDASLAVYAGADALGLNFYQPSPRYVSLDLARDIALSTPAFVTSVGLFVDAEPDFVEEAIGKTELQLLQFHGNESPEYCEQFGLPYIKALRVGHHQGGLKGDALRTLISSHSNARAILLDAYRKGVPGGTGERFDWDLVPEIQQPIILAGGLTPDNVAEAVNQVKPYAVDVSGGVESTPGVKDAGRIRDFLNAVQLADRH